jgi:hypothetical protein
MATFAETMLAKYETLLQASAGLDTVSVDGQSVRYTSPTGYYMAHTYGALPASFAAYATATEITASPCPAVFLRFSA